MNSIKSVMVKSKTFSGVVSNMKKWLVVPMKRAIKQIEEEDLRAKT